MTYDYLVVGAGFAGSVLAERLASHYQTILRGLVARPEWPVAQLPMLAESDRETQLTWGRCERLFDENTSVLDLFRQHAAATPGAIAIELEDRRLSYGELDERSDQLAALLRARYRVDLETLVALRMPRSDLYVSWILGILKAGGAFLPIDPGYPPARAAHMLADSGTRLLVTDDPDSAGDFDGMVIPAAFDAAATAPGGSAARLGGTNLAYLRMGVRAALGLHPGLVPAEGP